MTDSKWTKILGWPGYRVYRSEINQAAKTLRLWVRRKRGNRKLVCSGCGQRVREMVTAYEREVRDLPCFEYRTTGTLSDSRSEPQNQTNLRKRSKMKTTKRIFLGGGLSTAIAMLLITCATKNEPQGGFHQVKHLPNMQSPLLDSCSVAAD